MARLDRLGAVPKEIAQIGAAIGREFSYELLSAVAPRGEAETQAALARLVAAGLVFQRGTPPTAEYQFKHALVQDTAYGTLLRGPRQALHTRIAAALEARFLDRVAREPEALARHFSEAQQPDRALGYWLAAGERAIRHSANQEAIGHLTGGLAQLAQLPDTADRTKQELALQRLLGQANFHVRGLGALETDRAFSRARELCAVIDDDQSIIPVLWGLIIVEWGAGQLSKAETTANEILQRAGR
jgi:predicted ATPase